MKKTRNKKFIGYIAFVIFSLVIFLFGYQYGKSSVSFFPTDVTNINAGKPADVDFSTFWQAWQKIKEKSVYDANSSDLVKGAISGMMSSLKDPYTVYFDKKDNQRFHEDIQGEFFGIGIEIISKNNMPTVVAPLADSPAEKAGIKSGDIILTVDGKSTGELGLDETVDAIRGENNTTVALKIVREQIEEPFEVKITRAKIVMKSIELSYKEKNGKQVAYIKIRQFGDDTNKLFEDAAKDILQKKPSAVILDLRNNPGGYLESAIKISSYFIEKGVIVTEQGKKGDKKDYNSEGNSSLKNYNVIILTNGGSASASEIVAGALRDRKSAKLIGEKTFGKGSVQELIDLSDGSAVKITVAKWLTPNGAQINGEGLKPDIEVLNDSSEKTDSQLEKALEVAVN